MGWLLFLGFIIVPSVIVFGARRVSIVILGLIALGFILLLANL
jgi:hypothetical protein